MAYRSALPRDRRRGPKRQTEFTEKVFRRKDSAPLRRIAKILKKGKRNKKR